MATNEKPNHFNLAYTGFSTDKAKDDAYMADQQKAQKVADTVRAKKIKI